jgi:hypothetical protein
MRNYLWTIFVLILFAGTACQQQGSIEKEKEAILAVLKEEADANIARDKERLFAVHVQDSLETRLELGEFGYNIYKGWDRIKTELDDFIDGAQKAENMVNKKENMIIKVTGKSAWLTCDNIWEWSIDGEPEGYNNIQVTFLEKIEGEWKISFSAYYSKPRHVVEIYESDK